MPLPARRDGGRVQVEPRVGGWFQSAGEVGGPASVTGTDLQHPLAAEIGLGRRAVVELDGKPVWLVRRRQRQSHRRIFLVTVIEELPVPCDQAGEERVEDLREGLHDVRVESQAVDTSGYPAGNSSFVHRHCGSMQENWLHLWRTGDALLEP